MGSDTACVSTRQRQVTGTALGSQVCHRLGVSVTLPPWDPTDRGHIPFIVARGTQPRMRRDSHNLVESLRLRQYGPWRPALPGK